VLVIMQGQRYIV